MQSRRGVHEKRVVRVGGLPDQAEAVQIGRSDGHADHAARAAHINAEAERCGGDRCRRDALVEEGLPDRVAQRFASRRQLHPVLEQQELRERGVVCGAQPESLRDAGDHRVVAKVDRGDAEPALDRDRDLVAHPL